MAQFKVKPRGPHGAGVSHGGDDIARLHMIVHRFEDVFQVSVDRVEVISVIDDDDVAGAGDTVVSALTMALASGLDLVNAAAIANCAGGAVVRKVGVAVTSVDEILGLLHST